MTEFRSTIDKQRVGDRSIRTANWNEQVEKVNALGKFIGDPNNYELVRWTGSQRQVIPRGRPGQGSGSGIDYHFKISKSAVSSVRVTAGDWTRNGAIISMTLDGGQVYKTLTGLSASSTTYYITLTLSSSATRDPALIPNTLTVTAETSLPASDGFNIAFVLGEITTDTAGALIPSTLDQYWTGGDIDDYVSRPDTESATPGTDPWRSTIEYNPEAGIHNQELQLTNSDTVTNLQPEMCYLSLDANGTGVLQWAVIDSQQVGGTQQSLEIDTGLLEIYHWHLGTPAQTPVVGDKLIFREAASKDLFYADADDVFDLVSPTGWGGQIVSYFKNHNAYAWIDLSDTANALGNAGEVVKVNAGGTALEFLDGNTVWWVQGGDETNCFGTNVGDSGNNSVIDLDNLQLEFGAWQATDATDVTVDATSSGLSTLGGFTAVKKIYSRDVTDATATNVGSIISEGGIACEKDTWFGGTSNAIVGFDTPGIYQVNTVQVVSARATGWANPSGTAARANYAVFAGQTITNPPTQAEVQAIDDHVVILSQTLKALIIDLHANASHGLIGN